MSNVFPFTALVGQERMKLGLVLNAVNPKIGGVLIRGEKGTAKSTAVRALANLLPELEVTPGCPYGCLPGSPCPGAHRDGYVENRHVRIVELPVGATEDRVIGSLDIGGALKEGEVRFKPGLLAAANRGILYVDEVNLLNDHLVDVLLDAAAMGCNYVEREGISFDHPAQFLLVGTMNPEEGDLRPQLLDRFALAVEVRGDLTAEERVDVVRRRLAFEHDPVAFSRKWQKHELEERKRIVRAQRLLPRVDIDDGMLNLIARICSDVQVDGLRADIVMVKTAITLAAYHGRRQVNLEDVRQAAEFALQHRRRRQPFESPGQGGLDEVERAIEEHSSHSQNQDGEGTDGAGGEQVYSVGRQFKVESLAAPRPRRQFQMPSGRRTRVRSDSGRGYYVAARTPRGEVRDLAFDASVRAAALRQAGRSTAEKSRGVRIEAEDLREKVRETRSANFILFAVDASGSMAARERMVATKGAVLSLLLDAYQKRDQVGMISFRGKRSELLLPPTNSVDLAERQLRSLPTGGRTPLGAALQLGLATIKRYAAVHKEVLPLFVLVSDGRPNVSLTGGDALAEACHLGAEFARERIHSIVVDTESGGTRLGMARRLAEVMEGEYVRLDELEAGRLAARVRRTLGRPD